MYGTQENVTIFQDDHPHGVGVQLKKWQLSTIDKSSKGGKSHLLAAATLLVLNLTFLHLLNLLIASWAFPCRRST